MARRESKLTIYRLERGDIERILAGFEDRYEEEMGERLSSREFYSRYVAGEFDSTLATAWATYWEAYIRVDSARRVVEHALSPLVPSSPLGVPEPGSKPRWTKREKDELSWWGVLGVVVGLILLGGWRELWPKS